MPVFHNAITVLGSRGEAPKSQFGALVPWLEIAYQHRKDSVRAKAPTFSTIPNIFLMKCLFSDNIYQHSSLIFNL